jgi:hypothetical protein
MAAGILSLAQDALRSTLADSTTYRALTDPVMEQAAALASIHRDGLPAPADTHEYTLAELEGYRPFATIVDDDDNSFAGSTVDWMHRGRMLVTIERDAPDGASPTPSDPATKEWRDIIGQIIADLQTVAGTAGYLDITSIDMEEPPGWAVAEVAETRGVFQMVVLGVNWQGAGP